MARRIRLNVPGIRLNETAHSILNYVAQRARAEHHVACSPVQIARREFVGAAGVSTASIIRTSHTLVRQGLMECAEVVGEGGARDMNSYALTALGIEVLRLADDAVQAGEVGVR